MSDDVLSFADVMIEAMPFSNEIIAWCHSHPEFKNALKISNPTRFYPLGMVQTSCPAAKPEDYVIGFTSYDMVAKKFKQDFIVDVGNQHDTFVLYTNLPGGQFGRHVKHINEFYAIYGKDNGYADTHHFGIEKLLALNNPELIERALRAIERGRVIEAAGGLRRISQEELRDVLEKIRDEKARLK